MSFLPGRLPAFVITAALALPGAVAAQHNIPLTLAEAEDIALAYEPGRAAMQASAAAIEARAGVAAALPDPTLRVGLNNYPVQSGGFSTEGMTNGSVGLRQAFPAGDTRELASSQYRSLASEMQFAAGARGEDVLAAVRQTWLDVHYWEHAHRVVAESRPFFADLAEVTRSLYAVGRKNQQDVLRAELELGRLDDRLIEIDRQRRTARAVLRQWIGSDADRPLPPSLPAPGAGLTREELHARLEDHPLLHAAAARITARETGVELANQRSKPGWALDVGYSYRDGTMPDGGARPDLFTVGVTVDLPFFRKPSVDGTLTAALQERRAALESRELLRRQLATRLDAEFVRWQDLGRRIELYEQRILGQAELHAQAALLAYQSDRGDFADVMRGYVNDLNTRLDVSRLRVERAQAYAVLANLGGIPR